MPQKNGAAPREKRKERIRMSKVVIELEGGLVQSVYSDDKKIQVVVLDHDVYEDLYPKLDMDVFFIPEFDPELAVMEAWKEKKAAFMALYPHFHEG